MIASNGHPYLNNKKEVVHTKTTVDVMQAGGETIECNRFYSVRELEHKLRKVVDDSGLPIIQPNTDMLIGYIASNELDHAIRMVRENGSEGLPCFFRHTDRRVCMEEERGVGNDFTKWMDQAPLGVNANTTIEFVVELFTKLGVKTLMVVQEGR